MADTNDRVMAMVQEELGKNPGISATELQEKAKKIDPAMADLSTRQFHARYPLQVKRARSGKKAAKKAGRGKAAAKKGAVKKPRAAKKAPKAKRGGKRAAKKATAKAAAAAPSTGATPRGRAGKGSEGVKSVLVDFASKIAGADTSTLVKVMGDLDRWAERVTKAAG